MNTKTKICGAMFPGRYIQGKDIIDRLESEIKRFSDSAFIISAPSGIKNVIPLLTPYLKNIKYGIEQFNGECCDTEIERLTNIAGKFKPGVIIGLGGGKALDTAKVVAYNLNVPVIIFPSIASTDAPCSMKVVVYTEMGVCEKIMNLTKNPDIVFIDSQVIANAPTRFLIAGMGDALSTYFEAKSCSISNSDNTIGLKAPLVTMSIAEKCYELLIKYGLRAKQDCEKKLVTNELNYIIEANTLLSGLGFESGGLASPHAIYNGFTELSKTHKYYHGEIVAFGTQVSLFINNFNDNIKNQVYSFCESVGLATTLSDIGLTNYSKEDLYTVAESAMSKNDFIFNEPVKLTGDLIVSSILKADEFGRLRKFDKGTCQCQQ